MFIENLRDDFYNLLIGKRILLIVNYDLDAICASKILISLFKFDNMLYSLIPVMGMSGLQRAYNEHRNDVKHVLLVNCGGGIDLVDVLQPDEDVVFYVCDSHRPYNVCNVYSNGQVSKSIFFSHFEVLRNEWTNVFCSGPDNWNDSGGRWNTGI